MNLEYGIVIAVPVVIAVLRGVVPQLPRRSLPWAALVLGIAMEAGLAVSTGTQVSPELGAALGAAGVGLREVYNQTRKAIAGE